MESLKENNKERAYALYRQHHRLQAVCAALGTSYGTVFRWRQEGNWDERLLAEQLSTLPATKEELSVSIPTISPQEIQEKVSAELRQLDVLEMRAIAGIVLDDVRPRTWTDVMSTLRFVGERRDILAEKITRLAINMRRADLPLGAGLPEETTQRITAEQHIYIKSLVELVTSDQRGIQATTKVLEGSPSPNGKPSKEIRDALIEQAIALPAPEGI